MGKNAVVLTRDWSADFTKEHAKILMNLAYRSWVEDGRRVIIGNFSWQDCGLLAVRGDHPIPLTSQPWILGSVSETIIDLMLLCEHGASYQEIAKMLNIRIERIAPLLIRMIETGIVVAKNTRGDTPTRIYFPVGKIYAAS